MPQDVDRPIRSWFYDRTGSAITAERADALLGDHDYKIVARDDVDDDTAVSTVWLGVDHSSPLAPAGEPVIFETMILTVDEELHGQQWRYRTEDEARMGHQRVVDSLREGDARDQGSVSASARGRCRRRFRHPSR